MVVIEEIAGDKEEIDGAGRGLADQVFERLQPCLLQPAIDLCPESRHPKAQVQIGGVEKTHSEIRRAKKNRLGLLYPKRQEKWLVISD